MEVQTIQATCSICGKVKKVNPSDIKDVNNYHCKKCHPIYLKQQRENGGKINWDWSTLRKLNKIAMSNGHKNMFGAKKNGSN